MHSKQVLESILHIRKRGFLLVLKMFTEEPSFKGQICQSIISYIFTPVVCNVLKPLGVRLVKANKLKEDQLQKLILFSYGN